MEMAGPLPKNPKIRQRRNRAATAKKLQEKKASLKIPELPKRRGIWRPEATVFWEEIWKSPMATEFIAVDIQGLYLLMDLVHEYYKLSSKELGKKKELANEIRLQRQCFGLTPIDRVRLQWQIEKADDANTRGQRRREKGRKVKHYKVDPRTVLGASN